MSFVAQQLSLLSSTGRPSLTRVDSYSRVRLMRDYPSTFFLVYIFKCVITLCIWIMIIISVFVLCTCITVSDFIFLRTRVYHVDRRDFRYWRGCVSEDFITYVTHHAALPMQPQRRYFCIEMALQLHLIIVKFVILPNYRMINYYSIFDLSSGVTCNWCI